jgi:hypothetical protein
MTKGAVSRSGRGARGKFYGKKSVFWKLCEQAALAAKKFNKAAVDFFGNPPIAS